MPPNRKAGLIRPPAAGFLPHGECRRDRFPVPPRKGNGNGITLRKVRRLFVRSPPDQLGFVGYGEGKLAAEIDIVDGQSLHQPIVPADFPDGGIKVCVSSAEGTPLSERSPVCAGECCRPSQYPAKVPAAAANSKGCGQADDFDPFFHDSPPLPFWCIVPQPVHGCKWRRDRRPLLTVWVRRGKINWYSVCFCD